MFKKCPSLLFNETIKLTQFEEIINAENNTFCSLATFKVRDKPFYVEPNAMKALGKQRLLKNISMESRKPSSSSVSTPFPNVNKGDLNGLISSLLEC